MAKHKQVRMTAAAAAATAAAAASEDLAVTKHTVAAHQLVITWR
jgi:hypothetical protein